MAEWKTTLVLVTAISLISTLNAEEQLGPAAAKAYVDYMITAHPVMVFSKSYCRDMPPVRQVFDSYKLSPPYQPYVVDLDKMDNMMPIQDYLEQTTGKRSVPRVFVNGRSVGGADETAISYRSGQLTNMLRQAGAKV